MKAVVHIGTSKTGTTAIQRALAANCERLAGLGVFFGRFKEPQQASNVELAMIGKARTSGAIDADTLARVFGPGKGVNLLSRAAAKAELDIADAIANSDAEIAVFSAEQLTAWMTTPEEVRALDNFLTGVFSDVRYVVYLRPQEDWSLSIYSQLLRYGYDATLDDHARSGHIQDYEALLTLWADTVGAERLDIRLYDRAQFPGGDVVADFFTAVGIDPAALASIPHQNEALSAPVAALFQQMNVSLAARDLANAARWREQTVLRKLFNRAPSTGPKLRFSPDQIAAIRDRVAAGNEAVRARFFPDRPELFPPRPATETATDDSARETMALTDVAAILAMLQKIERKMAATRAAEPNRAKVQP